MKKKYLNTLFAIVLLGALYGGLTYWDKRKASEPAKPDTTTSQEKLLALESSHIQSFTIKPREGEAITCRREGANWVIAEPKKVSADASAVSGLLNSLTGATVDQVVEAKPANLKDFGLDPPSATVQVLTDAKPAQFSLSLGDEKLKDIRPFLLAQGGPAVLRELLDAPLEIATPGDTGRAFINALKHLDVLNKNIYNLSGGEKCRITYSDFLSRSFEIFGLGPADFQKNTFARKNFHCGYYEDGDLLNEILDFRRDSIEDYFNTLKKSVPPVKRIATTIFRKIIKLNLERQSEPLIAIKTDNEADIQHYF